MSRNISDLHPRLQTKANELVALCAKNGIKIAIGECLRTVAEQNALYAQGRTTAGSIVTNCTGTSYKSMHQWGVAFDFFLKMDVDGDGSVSDDAFNDSTGLFERVGALGQSLGLEWGGAWTSIKDRPHFQLPDWGSSATKLIKQYGNPDAFRKTWGTDTSNMTPITTPEIAGTAGTAIVASSSGLKMRVLPTTTANVLLAIPTGVEVQVLELSVATANGIEWARVSHVGNVGYCAQKYLKVTKAPNVVPSPVVTTYSKSDVDDAQNKKSSLSGTYQTTANLNLRAGAGSKKSVITTLAKGTKVKNYGYYTEVSGTKWLLVSSGKYTGFCSSAYLKKV